ncbi:hypothetical protein PENSPDRAFT_216784 [Peniophora sp. CONT]|nr:hypothetical protein PENSPDRAFT_216784 [Peniophora sp. CONT]
MFNALLTRARNAPLSTAVPPLSLAKYGGASEQQIAYTLAHPERFRTLEFREPVKCDWATALSGKTLPHLERATFKTQTPSLNHMHAPIKAPVLLSLSFHDFFVRFEAPRLSTLRIKTPSRLSRLTFDFAYLREVLAGVPTLVVLELHGCLPTVIRSQDANLLELPNLKLLGLGGPCSSLSIMLLHLRPSNLNTTIVHLNINNLANHADIIPLADALQPYFRGSSRNTVRVRPNSRWFFEACALPSFDRLHDESGLVFLSLDAPPNLGNQWMLSNLYMHIFWQFPVGQLDHLMVVSSPTPSNLLELDSSTNAALTVPQLVESVHTILYHINTTGLHGTHVVNVDIIPRFLWDSDELGSDSSTYGKLETLVLRAGERVYASIIPTNRPLGQLRDWLHARKQVLKPLRTLILEGEAYANGHTALDARIAEDATIWRDIGYIGVCVMDKRKLLVRPPE